MGLALTGVAAEFRFGTQTLTVPEGFEVELVAGPPLVDRPMMADFDEAGRLYVADSAGMNDPVQQQLETKPHRIVRLEDVDGDGRFDRSVVFADRMMFPEGVLWHDGAVYSGAPPSIWKLVDTDGDGVADQRTEWFKGGTLTGCANDLHGPYLGVDGWIYWCKGAFARQTHERPGHRPVADSAAHLFRCLPDGTAFDAVMGGGMDNPVEVAFTPEGEVFFSTTFFVHPEAGRRDALVHCIYGGAYPKVHGVVDALQQTGELLPPLTHLGPAAACALMRYDSAVFGAEYEGNLFSSLFNLRKVMRHRLAPAGGTFRSDDQDFLVSDQADFHPTDVLEDADGSLLVIDTGGWYKLCCPTSQLAKPEVLGAIYRVRRRGAATVDDPRGLRLGWTSTGVPDLVALLGDARPAVRRRAVETLARRGGSAIPALRDGVRQGASVLARQQAIWALTRLAGAAAREAVRAGLADPDRAVRLAALHAVAMRRDGLALPRVLGALRSGDAMEQRKAAEALGRIGDRAAVPALFEAVASFRDRLPPGDAAAERIQEHALIFALIEVADREGTAVGLKSVQSAVRRAALIALDQMDGGRLDVTEVAPLLSSSDELLRSTAGWIAVRHPDWGDALAGHFASRLRGEVVPAGEREALRRQLARFGRNGAVQDLLARVLTEAATPASVRTLVLGAMADAGVPEAPARWRSALARVLEAGEAGVLAEALRTVRQVALVRTNCAEVSAALLRVGRDATRPASLRVEALAGIPGGPTSLEPALFEMLVARLAPAEAPELRSAAAAVLARTPLTEDQLGQLVAALATVGPMELNRLLEAFAPARAEALGMALVDALRKSKALASVRVDLLRQRLAQFPASVQSAGRELLRLLDVDPEAQAAALDRLEGELAGGDIRRGQVVFNSPKTACVTCHALGYVGGRVGPDLTSIGQIRTARDLLESIVYPNASFVRSFEPVIVMTREGDEFSGVLQNESPEEVVLATGPGAQARIARKDILEQRPGVVSVMPSGLAEQLSRTELADLVAFLKATKWGAQ